jgi:hypothetical protein
MDVWIRAVVIILCTIFGSGGWWAYLQSRDSKKDATTRILMGLVYTQLTTLGQQYIDRGSVTKDEFEDYVKYFYEPYRALGGNGFAERIMRDVKNLPLRPLTRQLDNQGWTYNVPVVSRSGQEASAE